MKINKRAILAASICLTVLSLAVIWYTKQPASSAASDAQPSPSPQASNQDVNAKLVAANTQLSFKLFSQILKQQPNENIFISPISVAIALEMVYNGANGQTQQAIAQALQLQGMSLQEINEANATLKAALKNPDPKVQLSIANSLWAKAGQPFNPEFVQKIRDSYGAEVKTLNFDDPTAPSIINDWVKQSTNQKIDKIVEEKELEPGSVFVLLNAIYFLGSWKYPFPKTATQERPFTLLNGTQKQHPMMSQDIYGVGYYENELFQAIELPYGEGRLRMYIFLPNKGISLQTFYQRLNAENWNNWIKQLDADSNGAIGEEILISLPRFKLEYSIELKDTLKALGMEIAFTTDADFSAMSSSRVRINKVKQKTFVEVNEAGTEAAAVTEVSGTRGGVMMVVDRPFFVAIRDKQTGTILFMGSIVEPQ
jgi:serpin B